MLSQLNFSVYSDDRFFSRLVKKLYGGRSLYENTAFMMPEVYEALKRKGYRQIDKDKVVLKSSVLKNK